MTVYVVTAGEYSDYGICAVFTDKEKAEIYAAAYTDKRNEDCYVEEYDTEEVEIESSKPPKRKWRMFFDKYGVLSQLGTSSTLTFREVNQITPGRNRTLVIATLDKDIPKEKAEKIICDRFAKWKAERMMNDA